MLKKSIPLFLLALPVALSFFFVFHFAVDVPWGDQLDILPHLFEKCHEGNLALSDLTSMHNEHRIFFPRVVMLALAWLTHWDTRVEMLLIQVMLLASLLLLSREMRLSGHIGYWWLTPLPWLIFNLKQWETMLFGVQIAYILPILAALLALSRLAKLEKTGRPWMEFIIASAAALVASFCIMAGLLVWPAGAAVLLLGWKDIRTRRLFLPMWLCLGFTTWIVYFSGLPAQATTVQLDFATSHPPALFRFFLALLGNALIARQTLAPLAGVGIAALLMLTAVFLTRNRCWRENRFWVGVVLFTLASLSSIAVGRAWVGTEAAFAPRYTTFSLILLAALYALLANLVRGNPSRLPRFVLSGLLIVIVLSLPIALYRGWSFGEQQHEKESKQAWVLRNAATLPDAELIIVHPIPQVVRRGAQILQRFRCSVFRDSPQPEKSY